MANRTSGDQAGPVAAVSSRSTATSPSIPKLLVYCGGLVLAGMLFPFARFALPAGREPLPPAVGKLFDGGLPALGSSRLAVLTSLSMMAALALAIPIAWVHSIVKPSRQRDRSVAETLVILPIAVSAIAMMVQNSLPLAFSLAGIVAAVRFRNTLRDANDAVYVFVAIGIGLAAGVQALAVAAVMSGLFTAVVLAMARLRRESDTAEAVDLQETPRAEKAHLKGILVVRAVPYTPAWQAVEGVLQKHARHWRLLEAPPAADAEAPLEYRVQLRRKTSPALLLEEVRRRGRDDVLGAELRLFAGKKEEQHLASPVWRH